MRAASVNVRYVKGLKGEAGLNLRYRKAQRRDLALIRVVDTGLRLVDLSRSSFRGAAAEGTLDLSRWARCAHALTHARTRHVRRHMRERDSSKAERGGGIKRRESAREEARI